MGDIRIYFDEDPKHRKRKVILFIVLGVVVILLFAVFGFFLGKYFKKRSYEFAGVKEKKELKILNRFSLEKDKRSIEHETIKKAILYYRKGEYDKAKRLFKSALSLGLSKKEQGIVYNYLAAIYSKKGAYDVALDYLKKAIEVDGDNPVYYRNIAFIYKELGDYDKAILFLEKAKDLSKGVDYYIMLAELYYDDAQYEKALDLLKEAYDREPKNQKVNYLLGKVYKKLGNITRAIEYFKKAASIDENTIYGASSFAYLGNIYMQLRDYEQARYYYSKALDISPDDSRYLYNMAVALVYSGKKDEALPYLLRAVRLSDNKEILVLSGDLLKDLGKYEEARNAYKKAYQMDKTDYEVASKLAEVYEKLDMIDSAIFMYIKALDNTEGSLSKRKILLKIGELYEKKEDYENAVKIYKKALLIQEDDDVYFRLANAYIKSNEEDKALKLLNEVLKKHPDFTKSLSLLGKLYYEKGLFEEAQNVFVSVLDSDKNNEVANYYLANIYLKKGKYDEAMTGFEDVISSGRDPKLVYSSLVKIAFINYKKENLDKAIEFSKKAISYSPQLPEAYLILANSYIKRGEYFKAISVLKKAVLLDSSDKMKSKLYTLLGISFYKIDELSKALKYFQKALDYDPENETARINLDAVRNKIELEIR